MQVSLRGFRIKGKSCRVQLNGGCLAELQAGWKRPTGIRVIDPDCGAQSLAGSSISVITLLKNRARQKTAKRYLERYLKGHSCCWLRFYDAGMALPD